MSGPSTRPSMVRSPTRRGSSCRFPPLLDPDLAPPGRHVVSAYVQFVPYVADETAAAAQRDRLARTVTRTIERYAPGFAASVVAQQVITPFDLERTYGLTGGHIFHGELALDQLLTARPLLGWARYRTPIRDLYLCGSGTHPGRRAHRTGRRARLARNSRGPPVPQGRRLAIVRCGRYAKLLEKRLAEMKRRTSSRSGGVQCESYRSQWRSWRRHSRR